MNFLGKTLIILISAVLALFTLAGDHGVLRLFNINREISRLAAQNSALESEIVSLKNKTHALAQNDFVLEKEAREQLGLARPGEVVYVFSQAGKK